MNPFVTFTEAHGGKRIYSIETQAGVVHVIADQVFEHLSEAVAVVKDRVPNPVVEAMEAEVTHTESED